MKIVKLDLILAAIDHYNLADPVSELDQLGAAQPKALLYGLRMSQCLARYAPDAPDVLQIAARGQHIGRWESPRSDYPMDRTGYLKWRKELAVHHADCCAKIMVAHGCDETQMDQVHQLLTKQNLKRDPLVQTLEDVICLVFLEFYLDGFANTQSEEKLVGIVQKTWGKMSDQGHKAALALPLSDASKVIVAQALAG
jgi:hypothetical protein